MTPLTPLDAPFDDRVEHPEADDYEASLEERREEAAEEADWRRRRDLRRRKVRMLLLLLKRRRSALVSAAVWKNRLAGKRKAWEEEDEDEYRFRFCRRSKTRFLG